VRDAVVIDIDVSSDPAGRCAELLAEAGDAGQQIVVTGGSTPAAAYERAAGLGADWSNATLWWSDERCVPPDDPLSNYGLVKRALLDNLPAAPAVNRMRGEAGPAAGADDYERVMRETLGEQLPRLDLILLGLGPDVHVASLFPSQPTLRVRDRIAVGVEQAGHEPYVPRISLTLPVICGARRIVFLVTGRDKAPAVARAFAGDASEDAPGSLVRPTGGTLTVLLDEAAASGLPERE
jgi:6-phosphogluconolactonase